MKVLIICSGNSGKISPFINEQINTLIKIYKIEIDTYLITGNGFWGYLKNLKKLKNKIRQFKPNIIHAHYGLSGLLSCLQRIVPTVITFHGSDAYIFYVKILSKIAAHLSAFNIFVGEKIKNRINRHKISEIVPCGIDLNKFYPIEKNYARKLMNLDLNKNYILFSSRFDNSVKNYPLVKKALVKLKTKNDIIELKNKTREEVNILLNACNLLILTSISEGSPQIVKEAMACNIPVVSTDVGDVKWLFGNEPGYYITNFDPHDVAQKIKLAIEFRKKYDRTNGRQRIIDLGLDSATIAGRIMDVYKEVLSKKC